MLNGDVQRTGFHSPNGEAKDVSAASRRTPIRNQSVEIGLARGIKEPPWALQIRFEDRMEVPKAPGSKQQLTNLAGMLNARQKAMPICAKSRHTPARASRLPESTFRRLSPGLSKRRPQTPFKPILPFAHQGTPRIIVGLRTIPSRRFATRSRAYRM